jgi:HK97 family phage major capsid protein
MYVKFLKDYDAAKGQKTGAVVQMDDAEGAIVIKTGFGEKAEAPAAVTTEVEESRKLLVKELAAELIGAGMTIEKDASGKRRPHIKVGEDNALGDPTDGFKGMAEFSSVVRKACQGKGDERLERRMKANAAGASENVNADGGYAVPEQYATTIFNDIIAQDSLFNSCFTIPMESNSMKLPALNYTKQGSFGVQAYWEGEAATIPTSKWALRQPQLTLNKLTVLTPVTSELLEDGIAVESTINFLASEAITYNLNDAIINGTGAGQPTGIVGHPSTLVVTRNTTDTVKSIDVISMDSGFIGDDDRAMWLISKADVNPQLLTIQDANGRYLYFAPGTFGDVKGPASMLGKRVKPLINCPPLNSSGDIILWDPKSYVIGYKSSGVTKAMSIHLYFATDQVAYRWTMRVDGRPWRDVTLQSAKSNSLYYGTAVVLSAA